MAPLPTNPAAILAVVGQSTILVEDVQPKVEAKLQEVLSKTDQEIPEAQLNMARLNLTRSMLAGVIQNKMLRESFLIEQVGTQSSEKREEADNALGQRARQMFFESELPQLLEQYHANDNRELDEQLRGKGSSLAARQRDFVDMMLGHLYIREKVDREPKVSLSEIVEYYNQHRDEYFQTDRARWEQLSAYFEKNGSEEATRALITEMGREAYFGGNLQAVARKSSQEPFASQGGLHDWTDRGALASETIDAQVFSLPVGRMSEIIRDDLGLHIIRVLEREDAGVTPLSELQDEIRAKIREEKIAQSQAEALRTMRERVPVWSLYPGDVPGAKPLPESVARRQATTR